MVKMERGPISYFGGKYYMTKHILPLIPSHKVYIEVFGGGAQILFRKRPSYMEVYNDIDNDLVNFFKVVADEKLFERFVRFVSVLPVSRSLFYEYYESWDKEEDIPIRVAKWFYVIRSSFSGVFGNSWSFSVSSFSQERGSSSVSKWLGCIPLLYESHNRLQRVQIESRDWQLIFDIYDNNDAFFYLDPPYLPETRKSGGYKHELTREDHILLVDKIIELKGQVMLSGYDNDIYKRLEANGFIKTSYRVHCPAIGNNRYVKHIKNKEHKDEDGYRTECLWLKLNKDKSNLF